MLLDIFLYSFILILIHLYSYMLLDTFTYSHAYLLETRPKCARGALLVRSASAGAAPLELLLCDGSGGADMRLNPRHQPWPRIFARRSRRRYFGITGAGVARQHQ